MISFSAMRRRRFCAPVNDADVPKVWGIPREFQLFPLLWVAEWALSTLL
jgi:hypothetical protein